MIATSRGNRPVFSFALPIFVVLLAVTGYVVYTNQSSLGAMLDSWNILPHEEPITELYINEYQSLPLHVSVGQRVPFSFTIHNLEGKPVTYPYVVYAKLANGKRAPIVQSSVTLANGYSNVVSLSYTVQGLSSPVTIYVELSSIGQSLHFTVPRRN